MEPGSATAHRSAPGKIRLGQEMETEIRLEYKENDNPNRRQIRKSKSSGPRTEDIKSLYN